MMYCNECKVTVNDKATVCPLCCAPLTKPEKSDAEPQKMPPAYPPPILRRGGYGLVKRILAFLSCMTAVICVVVNVLVPTQFWWSLIAITGICYVWIVVPHAMRRGGNLAGKVFVQVVFSSALVVLLDFELGWRAWSVSYVIPVILSGGITAVGLVILCNSTNWAGYVLYQVMLALFGFIPLVLCLTGLVNNFLFALVTSLFALAALIATIVFGDKSIKAEFKRRLRF
ncbi:MAG: DUF6320 domain-containing protein [Oscillospiraceae bacterium]